MMGFDKHLFISYAHLDNQPLPSEQQGWITCFHASLEAFLSMRLGRKTEIWRDEKLQGNDIFAAEIVAQFPHTALLVSILTPRYLKSEWCTREVLEFCHSAQHSGGVVVDNKARVFKVIKTPVDTEESLPPVMKDALGYEFFTYEDGAPLELDPVANPQAYRLKVNKLAWDIVQLLKTLEATTGVDVTDVNGLGRHAPAPAKPAIYLAECSRDRREARDILEGDLRRHGYTILPDQQLPREEEEYVAAVERLLTRCALSIHLVGESYGAVPDGPSQKSVTVLQNELAVQASKHAKLPRVIWLREGTISTQAPQQAFIEALHRDAEVQFGADLITGDLEALKTAIHATLKKLETPQGEKVAAPTTAIDRPKMIYLICDRKDRKATVPVRKFCREHGFDVQIPAFEGDATAIRAANQQLLTTCDAVILFYGAGDEAWKRTVDHELKKMPGYRGGKPLLATYTYLADPRTSDKEDLLDMEEPHVINGLEGFSAAAMGAFLQTMNP
jgi:hypothetical protein